LKNPFILNTNLKTNLVPGYQEILERLSQISGIEGQSIALIGQNGNGKTFVLDYLPDKKRHTDVFGDTGRNLYISHIKTETLSKSLAQSSFWKTVLDPLFQHNSENTGSDLAAAYSECNRLGFEFRLVEQLFLRMKESKKRLLLLVDDFDMLTGKPELDIHGFLSRLRSLKGDLQETLTYVFALRHPLLAFSDKIPDDPSIHSSYFTYLEEHYLGNFSDKVSLKLLGLGNERFSLKEIDFIKKITGGHPYLLVKAASELWSLHEAESDSFSRMEKLCKKMIQESHHMLNNTWGQWSPGVKFLFSVIGLVNASHVLEEHHYNIEALLECLPYFNHEREVLEHMGFIAVDPDAASGWRICIPVYLFLFMKESPRYFREDQSFNQWLRDQEDKGYLSLQRKEQLHKGVGEVGAWYNKKISTFIAAIAEGTTNAVFK